jgi:GNAT superfamily N-acetyltransferase
MPQTHQRASARVTSIPARLAKVPPQRQKQSAEGRLSFRTELLAKILTEVTPLLMRHHQELAYEGAFEPDWHALLSMNVTGRLHVLTARTESGVLVGYVSTRVDPSLFSKNYREACVDLMYLSPAYRSGWDGYRMLQENDRLIASWGVGKVYVAVPLTFQDGRSRSMFKRLGYHQTGETWTK